MNPHVVVVTEVFRGEESGVHDVIGPFPTEKDAWDFAAQADAAHKRDPAPAKSQFRWHLVALTSPDKHHTTVQA